MSLLAATFLTVFTCANADLKNCEVTEIGPMTETKCAALATHIGETARKLAIKETVIFFCTDDVDSLYEELPFAPKQTNPEILTYGY